MSRPRLVPVLTVQLWAPTHWRKALPDSGYSHTTYGFVHSRTVDYATRDGKTIERFGPSGLRIVRDCYGMLTYA